MIVVCRTCDKPFDPAEGHVSIAPTLCIDCWIVEWEEITKQLGLE